MNRKYVTLLVLLDLSAEFDTVWSYLRCLGLCLEFGPSTALSWFASYLSGRTQHVSVDGTLSTKFDLDCDVPQGSCLGPLLYFVYASKIFKNCGQTQFRDPCYVDDGQLYLFFCPNDNANQEAALASVERCIEDIRNWMIKLNSRSLAHRSNYNHRQKCWEGYHFLPSLYLSPRPLNQCWTELNCFCA